MSGTNGSWAKYLAWVERLPDNVLLCRRDGHRFAEITDKKRAHWTKRKHGTIEIEVPCLRRCGVHRTQFVDPDTGYLDRRNKVWMEYEDPDYLIPKEARSGKGYTADMRAVIRMETIVRNAELIVEE